jgi:hypothetical protein
MIRGGKRRGATSQPRADDDNVSLHNTYKRRTLNIHLRAGSRANPDEGLQTPIRRARRTRA